MDEAATCPVCHTAIRSTDYFCFNCGANLHPKPPSIKIEDQIMLYLGSFFLPPMGVIWGLKYINQKDSKSKTVGWVAFGLTVISILIAVQMTMKIMNSVSSQMNQLQGIQGF
jgi:predicted nucleic acid-binding Zn ribbon protein